MSLHYRDSAQVFIAFPWGGRSPDEVAAEALALLDAPPETWEGWWMPTRGAATAPPFAGPTWQQRSW